MFFRGGSNSTFDVNNLCFSDKSFSSLGLYLDKDYQLKLPRLQEDITPISMKGKNGSLQRLEGYNDRDLTIDFKLKDAVDFYARLDYVENYLTNNTNPILYMKGESRGYLVKRISFDLTRGFANNTLPITFLFEPFMVDLKETIIEGNNTITINNKGHFDSEPIITINTTNPNSIITLNGNILNLNNKQTGTITINTFLKEIIAENEILFITRYPILVKGDNIISVTNCNSIKIKYRQNYR